MHVHIAQGDNTKVRLMNCDRRPRSTVCKLLAVSLAQTKSHQPHSPHRSYDKIWQGCVNLVLNAAEHLRLYNFREKSGAPHTPVKWQLNSSSGHQKRFNVPTACRHILPDHALRLLGGWSTMYVLTPNCPHCSNAWLLRLLSASRTRRRSRSQTRSP